jgi:hypothetical protein
MSATPYIVLSALLKTAPPQAEWHAHGLDATHSLVVVVWDTSAAEAAFESMAGVIPLGHLWENLPALAATPLATMQPTIASTDTVGQALKKMAWPGARLVR